MEEIWNFIKLTFAIIVGTIASFLGGFDVLLQTLLMFVIIDYLTGVTRAGFEHKLSSNKGFKGIVKKVMIFTMVGIAFQLDRAFNTEQLRNIVIAFYIANEGLSILENSSTLGLPIPNKLKTILNSIKGDK